MTGRAAYDELVNKMRDIYLLGSCGGVLAWDERVNMPRSGSKLRSDQMGLLSGMIHEQFTSPRIGELLSAVEQSDLVKNSDSIEAANVRELRQQYDKQTKLPKSLVEEITKTTTLSQTDWMTARKNNDFTLFEPWLDKIFGLMRQKADAFGYTGEPYNALLDEYEPGATTDQISRVFETLRNELVDLLKKIANAPRTTDKSIVERDYDIELQRIFGESVAAAVGFDFNAGRLDVTTHPFCSGFGPGDTRITTRYNPKRLNDALFGIMHEVGHGLYEMGIEKEKYFGTPMGESASLGIHESQSRMWENQVGRSREFWVYFFPQAQRMFKSSLHGVTIDQFYGAINDVRPSYIRVEADEATYNLHILLRYEMERALLKGDIKAKDVPPEWNSRFKKYFGIDVDTDANGCLQDVHWSSGLVGYFPTYTLGNLYSAQFFAAAKKEMPNLSSQFERGEFAPLLHWLREKIHCHGQRYRANVLCEKITGKPLSHEPLVAYMKEKYSGIYGF